MAACTRGCTGLVAWQGPPTCTGTGFAGLEARKWRPAQHQAGSPHWAAGGSERGSVLNTPPQCTRPAFKRPCPRVVQEPAPTLQITAGAHLSFRVLSWRMPRSAPAAPADSRQRPPGPAGLGGPTPSISRLLPQRRSATASSNSKLTPLRGRTSTRRHVRQQPAFESVMSCPAVLQAQGALPSAGANRQA